MCEKALRRLMRSDRKLAARFDGAIQALATDPYPTGVVVLSHKAQYDLCRIKVGQSWRLIYGVVANQLVLLLLDAVAREGAYQNLETIIARLEAFLRSIPPPAVNE
jgi:mRNA-degrading endonuclease RelE of RelBE toxin-antitoxin system